MKKYPAYRDSGIDWLGKIPCEWGLKRLKTICSFIYGDSLASQDRVEGDIPVYGSNGIVGFHDRAITENPCIVIGRKGSFGKINYSLEKCFPIDTTYFIDKRYASCDLKWLSYILPLLELDKFSKDTGVPGLNREDALNKEIPVCLGEEQKFIADFLDKKTCQIDNLIAEKERLVELLKEERTALINHAVTRGLDPDVEYKDSGIEWLGKIPKHWEIKKLKYVADIVLGKMLTPSDKGGFYLKPYLRAKNLTWLKVNVNDVKEMWLSDYELGIYRLKKDDLLVSEGGEVGRTCIWEEELEECYIQNSVNRVRMNEKFNARYFLYQFYIFGDRGYFDSVVSRVSIAHLTKEKLADILVLVPMEQEQKAIADYLDCKTSQIDEQVDREKKLINYLKEYRTVLISEVVTGKIDVRREC